MWHLPFPARLQQLAETQLPPDTDYQGGIVQHLRPKASEAQQQQQQQQQEARGKGKAQHVDTEPSLEKKQQAPSNALLHVVRKQHLPVTPEGVQQLLAGPSSEAWYPTDGLVFTPNAAAYPLGQSELLMKWQPRSSIAVDLACLPRGSTGGLVAQGLVYECKPRVWAMSRTYSYPILNTIQDVAPLVQAQLRLALRPRFEMMGMAFGQQQHLDDRPSLLAAFRQHFSQATGLGRSLPAEVAGSSLGPRHPLLERPFQELRAELLAAVEGGEVQRWTEASSGLEVFNYLQGASDSEVNRLCRGLVLHPPTDQVVAVPFLRFP